MVSRKDEIIEQLKENGCRITKQRKLLIDIILRMTVQVAKKSITRLRNRTNGSGWRRFIA